MHTTRWRLVMWLVVTLLGIGLAPVSVGATLVPRGSRPRLLVSAHEAMADEGFRIAVVGVAPGELVELRLTIEAGVVTLPGTVTQPDTGAPAPATTWSSSASFRSDNRGRIDLATQAPVTGSYSGVDPMGLFWSTQPTFSPAAADPPTLIERTHLTAEVAGRPIDATDLTLDYLQPGSTATRVADDGLVGTLFQPAERGRHPAMLVFGGSEGGHVFSDLQAALFASHGYTALSLAYFRDTGLPPTLSRIPLEYFGRAIAWLARQPSVDPARIGARGGSRGGELALLLGTRYPQLKAVVAAAPSSVVWSGIGTIAQTLGPAWTQNGQPVPFVVPDLTALPDGYQSYHRALHSPAAGPAAIPVENINGPVLMLDGADDQIWPSPEMSQQVLARLRAHHHPYNDDLQSYPGTGHLISLPGLPTTVGQFGGDATDSAHTARAAWSTALNFLNEDLACSFHPRTPSRLEQFFDALRHRSCVRARERDDASARFTRTPNLGNAFDLDRGSER